MSDYAHIPDDSPARSAAKPDPGDPIAGLHAPPENETKCYIML